MRLRSTGLIRMGTLRGNRGLGPGCYGTLESVSEGAGPVVLLQDARWPVWGPVGFLGGSAASRINMRFVDFSCVTSGRISGEAWPPPAGQFSANNRSTASRHITLHQFGSGCMDRCLCCYVIQSLMHNMGYYMGTTCNGVGLHVEAQLGTRTWK